MSTRRGFWVSELHQYSSNVWDKRQEWVHISSNSDPGTATMWMKPFNKLYSFFLLENSKFQDPIIVILIVFKLHVWGNFTNSAHKMKLTSLTTVCFVYTYMKQHFTLLLYLKSFKTKIVKLLRLMTQRYKDNFCHS